MYLNKIFLIGRLTQEVELKELPSGTLVATVNLATNRFYRDKAGQQQKETEFHRIIAWARLAQLCKDYLTKGSLILVEGRIHYRSWLTPAGEKRYQTEITAENITFGPKNQNNTDQSESTTTLEAFEPPTDTFEVPY